MMLKSHPETVRRDNCVWAKTTLQAVLNNLLIEQSIQKAKETVLTAVKRLYTNKVDVSELLISRQLNRLGDYINKQPHTELAERMAKRNPGHTPSIGDRISFVYIKKTKKAKTHEKSEDPSYALEHELPIDVDFYIKQLKDPIKRIFNPILRENTETVFFGAATFKFKRYVSKETNTTNLTAYFKTKAKCLKCRKSFNLSEKRMLCEECLPFLGQIYLQKVRVLKMRQIEFNNYWSHCQVCQENVCQPNFCNNGDCPIFYRRMKVKKDLEKISFLMERFTL